MALWTTIVSNPLLKNTNLILFLNKIDIMKAKLASGIRLSDYVVSYGDRPNDLESTSHCEWSPLVAGFELLNKLDGDRSEEEIWFVLSGVA